MYSMKNTMGHRYYRHNIFGHRRVYHANNNVIIDISKGLLSKRLLFFSWTYSDLC